MKLINNEALSASTDVVFREEDDGAFLFHPETGELKCLNPLGAVIWSLFDGCHTIEDIEKEIEGKYPQIPREKIHNELLTFLQELLEIGYVGYQLSESPSPA
jgi:hypothetical protein